jgi:hypothetical protein
MVDRAKSRGPRRARDVHVPPAVPSPDASRNRIIDITAVLILTAMVLALGCKNIGTGGFGWSDAPLHAMDGVLLYDLARADDRGDDLKAWAARYYARYPCLGLVVYYPPLFAVIEAAAFAVFGISETVARGTVVAMAVVGVLGLYWLGVQTSGRPAGFLAAGLLATAPFSVTWLRQAMLEWPALAMAVLAAGCYQAWYHRPCWRWAVLGALATTAAILTKQTTLFLLALFMVHLVGVSVVAAVRQNWPPGASYRRHESDVKMALTVGAAITIILVLLGLYDYVSSRYADFSRFLVSGRPPWVHLRWVDTYTRYLYWFDDIFGWPFLIAWVVGLVVIVVRWEWRASRFSLLWLILVWVQQTLVAWKEPRYLFLALPAAALLAGRGWTLWPRSRKLPLGFAPIAGLIGYQFVAGMIEPAHRLPDYSAAVKLLADRGDADVVLMDGVREGQFIFDVRTNPQTAGRIVTLRGSKMLYSRAARGRWRHKTHRGQPQEIIDLLDHFGIKYVVVESQLPTVSREGRTDWDEPASRVLRQILADTRRFKLIGRWPLKCGEAIWDDVELRVYEYLNAKPRKAKTVSIPVPAIKQDVVVELP